MPSSRLALVVLCHSGSSPSLSQTNRGARAHTCEIYHTLRLACHAEVLAQVRNRRVVVALWPTSSGGCWAGQPNLAQASF